MSTKKIILVLLLAAVSSAAFAQERGEPVTNIPGNTYVGVGFGPDEQGEPTTLYKKVYREDGLVGQEEGWQGEINTVWAEPSKEAVLQNDREAAFDTDTVYFYTLTQPAPLSMQQAHYVVAEHDSTGERIPSEWADGGDTPDDYIPWKGRVDFKFSVKNTDNGPVLQITSHIANPHGVRLQKATVKVKDTQKGVLVEIKLPKSGRGFLGKALKLKYDVISYEEQTAKQQESAKEVADLLAQLLNK